MKFMVLFGFCGALVFSGNLLAEENKESKCVTREVLVLVKSTSSVHYSEKDEGKVISKVTLRDCGGSLIVQKSSPSVAVPANYCPPQVQDCDRP
jgi:hypothetical protein